MTSNSDTDRFLVARYLKRGDESSFRLLHQRHSPTLFRFALGRVGDSAADEVLQETWVRALRGLSGFQGRSSLRAWLIAIAANCCRELHRRVARERVDIPTDPPARSWAGERLELTRALARLPERARDVLLLHDVEGFTHKEIGMALEIEPGTSKSQLARARRLMREQLQSGSRRHA